MANTLSFTGGALQAPGGMSLIISVTGTSRLDVQVKDLTGALVAHHRLRLVEAAAYLDQDDEADCDPAVLHYLGKDRHPGGDQAAVSWLNDGGVGLLRLIKKGGPILVLPVQGRLRQEHHPIARRTGRRGPSRSSDLWVVVAALSLPDGFTIPAVSDITGLSVVTVRDALRKLQELGLVAKDPRKSDGFIPCLAKGAMLSTFLTERWSEWRRGTGTPSLRPTYRFFAAIQEWPLIHRRLQGESITCFPTSVTALEGGPDTAQKAWLMPSGLNPEIHCYVTNDDVDRFAAAAHVNLSTTGPAQGIRSSVCLLSPSHPVMRLVAYRRAKGFYQPAWPWGLAALDACDHGDARVRQVAREALQEWITNQNIECGKYRS